MHSLLKIAEWAHSNGAERSFTRLYPYLERLARSPETVVLDLSDYVSDSRLNSDGWKVVQIGDIRIKQEIIFSTTGVMRLQFTVLRWQVTSSSHLPVDEPRGWYSDPRNSHYYKKTGIFGRYEKAVSFAEGSKLEWDDPRSPRFDASNR
jgi:hypothetical protein